MINQKQIFPKSIFRAYDIRGHLGLLRPEIVQAIAYGLVNQFKQTQQQRIVLGYDARLTSPHYAEIIRQVFLQQQFEVIELGCCSSPMLYFIAQLYDGHGVMVTASHNPKSDNGIKWIINNLPPSPQQIQQVAQIASESIFPLLNVPNHIKKHLIQREYTKKYEKYLLKDIQLKKPFKIVLDAMHGSAGYCARRVLKKLGCNVIDLRCKANGHFPDHAPDPSKEQNLLKVKQKILQSGADLGLVLDGDGDRLVLLDENAQLICADRLLSLFSEICLQKHPQAEIVFDVKCSTMVKKTISRLGGKATMLRTGSTFLRNYLFESKAIFGGEYAGHYAFNDGRGLGYDDGLYAGLRVLEYLSQFNGKMTCSKLFQKYPKRCFTEDTYIPTQNIHPELVLNEIAQKSQKNALELSKIDGIRLDFEDGFGIIRTSNTGEYFTVRFDAQNEIELNRIRQTFAVMLQENYPKIAQNILDAQ